MADVTRLSDKRMSLAKTIKAPLLSRSRGQLRVAADDLAEVRRIANQRVFIDKHGALPDDVELPDLGVVERLVEANVLDMDGRFDPMAAELLNTINNASLTVTIDLHYGEELSINSIWATPKVAVVSDSFDADMFELRATDVGHLALVLEQLAVVRSPKLVGDHPISVNTEVLMSAERESRAEAARQILVDGGLDNEQASFVRAFQGPNVRRWRIRSAWSVNTKSVSPGSANSMYANGGTSDNDELGTAYESAELRGMDAGEYGQWLVAMTGNIHSHGQITFTPQGNGDILKSMRSVLPRRWIGQPLEEAPL